MFLLIDNFDSFTFNLVQAFQQLGADPVVVRNDRPELLDIAVSGKLERVCISPGPSHPDNSGFCLDFLKVLPTSTPVLGVCLGHQVLGRFAGAEVVRAGRIMHGKTSPITHDGIGLFENIAQGIEVCRYHSLTVLAEQASELLEVTSLTDQGEIMAMRYRDRPWSGLQFHPESILTPEGPAMLGNFLEMN